MALDEARTAANTIAEHVSDHNTVHAEINDLSATYVAFAPAPTGVAATDSANIKSALDDAEAATAGIKKLLFQTGTYVSERDGTNFYTQLLRSGVEIGGSKTAVIKMADSQAASVRMFATATGGTTTDVVIRDITLDGNKANQTVNEHRHALFLQDVTDVVCERVHFKDFTGDGAYLYNNADIVSFVDCEFSGHDRNGVTMGNNPTGVRITRGNFYDIAVQHVDAEPTAPNFATDVVIDGCYFDRGSGTDYLVTCAGTSTVRTRDWKITNNWFNGCVQVIWAEGVTITGNTWFVTNTAATKPCIELRRYSEGTSIVGNSFDSVETAIIASATSATDQPHDFTIAANVFNLTGTASAFGGTGASDYAIDGNTIRHDGTGAATAITQRFTVAVRNVSITNNLIRGAAVALSLYSSGTSQTERITVAGNTIDDDGYVGAVAFRIEGSQITGHLVLADNNLADAVTFSDTYALGTYLVGGNAHSSGAAIWSGTGTPEGSVTAPIGSQFLRRDGGVDTAVYTKQSGTGNTGWAPLSSQPVGTVLPILPYIGAASQVNWTTKVSSGRVLGGLQSSGVQNDEVTFNAYLAAGTWTFHLLHVRDANRGIYTVSFDAVDVGTIDGYNASSFANAQGNITGISVATSGIVAIRLKMATKNASSSSYFGDVQLLQMERTA